MGEMFDWGFSHYMRHAFPRDNLLPISCKGANWQVGASCNASANPL